MVASIVLECDDKALACRSRPWRGRRKARLVNPVYIFVIGNLLSMENRSPLMTPSVSYCRAATCSELGANRK